MPYFISLLCVAFVLCIQYFLSMWLIKTGWFYVYAWAMGGFLILIFIDIIILTLFFKENITKYNPKYKGKTESEINRLSIKTGNHQGKAAGLCVILTLLGGFWLNLELYWFHEKYEFDTFGIKTKAIITKKITWQNKGRTYFFILKTQEKPQPKELRYDVLSDEYASKNVGDTIAIIYSPRYRSMVKIQ